MATDLDPHAWVSLNVAHVSGAHAVLGDEPEGVGSGYQAVADWCTAQLARRAPPGLQQRIDAGRDADFEQLADDPIADVPLPRVPDRFDRASSTHAMRCSARGAPRPRHIKETEPRRRLAGDSS